jgi:hypothetical protein
MQAHHEKLHVLMHARSHQKWLQPIQPAYQGLKATPYSSYVQQKTAPYSNCSMYFVQQQPLYFYHHNQPMYSNQRYQRHVSPPAYYN